ncbi:hypothetical protein ACKKBG_A37085 [Auxenochlorella protothecoides x Auxenochlorella symbiontica]
MQVPAALYGSQLRTHPYLLDHHDIALESYGSGYTGESPVSWTHSPTHPGYEALESQTGLPAQVHVDKFPPRLGPDGGRAPGFKVQPYQVQYAHPGMEWSEAEAYAQAALLSRQQPQLGGGLPLTADLGALLGQAQLGAQQQQQQRQHQNPRPQQAQQAHMVVQRGPGPRQGSQGTHRGRSRNGGQANSQGYRRMWQQLARSESGSGHGVRGPAHQGSGPNGFSELTVEGMVLAVRRLPPGSPVLDAVQRGLYALDAGALAALLKELHKGGQTQRAAEIFDWLRGLEPGHPLAGLCNTMTYTTMISQCGAAQHIRRALELVSEMKTRRVPANVHTYSALMNVCIKGGELELALDVYCQMLAEGCRPNLVTYNTLIDVYGKTGAWEDAVRVLDLLARQGIEPEVRTYNTVIIACNMSGQAGEALRVYDRMLAAGGRPTATTFTALISAHGKRGQLDRALAVFDEMVAAGCERNVITYSSLISACEKAGRWELALDLFAQMHVEGCAPNVVTYNSLIAACCQGAQWQKAEELFEQMQARGCPPDTVTYGGLMACHERGGQWRRVVTTYEQMRGGGGRPDSVVYNVVVGALWSTGAVWAQARAAAIFRQACRSGHFRLTVHTTEATGGETAQGATPPARAPATALPGLEGAPSWCTIESAESAAASTASLPQSPLLVLEEGDGVNAGSPGPAGVLIEFSVHAFSLGSAVLCLLRWVGELRERLPRDRGQACGAGTHVALVINKGKPCREHAYPGMRSALHQCVAAWKAPFTLRDVTQGCRLEAPAGAISAWLGSEPAQSVLAAAADLSSSPPEGKAVWTAALIEDLAVEVRCSEAFVAVRRFEEGPGDGARAEVGPLDAPALAMRTAALATARRLAGARAVREDVLHDGVLLLDRVLSSRDARARTLRPDALAAACLAVAAANAGAPLPGAATLDPGLGLTQEALDAAVAAVGAALGAGTNAISALRILKLYMERLGVDLGAGGEDAAAAVGGRALADAHAALESGHLLEVTPSLGAAALVIHARREAGLTPDWPQILVGLTGLTLEDPGLQNALGALHGPR